MPCTVPGCRYRAHARGLCSTHYRQWWMTLKEPLTRPWTERFWARVDKNGPNGCWLWTGNILPSGYAQVRCEEDHKLRRVHRVMYELMVGHIPDGLELDHLCHTKDKTCPGGSTCIHRRCVHPEHLEPVTLQVNHQRMKGRKTHCPQGHPYVGDNIRINEKGYQMCRTCLNARCIAYYYARKSRSSE